jgi:putative membrane protein
MAQSKTSLASVLAAIAVAGLVACGGSKSQNPPKAPVSSGNPNAVPEINSPTGIETSSSSNDYFPLRDPGADAANRTPDTSAPPQVAVAPPTRTPTLTSGVLPTAMAAPLTPPNTPLTDAQIAEILDALNVGEIEQAREVLQRSKNDRVRRFAEHMIGDHGAAKEKGRGLERDAQISPQASSVSDEIKSNGVQIVSMLDASKGFDLDRVYMDAQIVQHQQALDLIVQTLLPQAKDAQLKSTLMETRDVVAHHLQMAKDIRASLKP